jgi:hypothetical protein
MAEMAGFEAKWCVNMADDWGTLAVCVRGLLLTIREKLCNLCISSLDN